MRPKAAQRSPSCMWCTPAARLSRELAQRVPGFRDWLLGIGANEYQAGVQECAALVRTIGGERTSARWTTSSTSATAAPTLFMTTSYDAVVTYVGPPPSNSVGACREYGGVSIVTRSCLALFEGPVAADLRSARGQQRGGSHMLGNHLGQMVHEVRTMHELHSACFSGLEQELPYTWVLG
jgi:hypothetical protein